MKAKALEADFSLRMLFGRSMRRNPRGLSRRLVSGRKALSASAVSAPGRLSAALSANLARQVSQGLADPVHIYVAASFEARGYT